MSKPEDIRLHCPCCKNNFWSRHLTLLDHARAHQRTDLYTEFKGVKPLQYGVHVCLACGYAGERKNFETDVVSEEVYRLVFEHLYPQLAESELRGSDKNGFAACVAEWSGKKPHVIAHIYKRAAWCCVEEEDTEAELYYYRKAVHWFGLALDRDDCVPTKHRAKTTYLVGEIWRRLGEEVKAELWFDQVQPEIIDHKEQDWLHELAMQQRHHPQEWIMC